MNEIRLLGRAAIGLVVLALLLALIAWHGVRVRRVAGEERLGMTLAGPSGRMPSRDGGTEPVITSLRSGGLADRAGLHVGDVVETVGGRAPSSLAEMERAMASDRPTDLRVRRGMQQIAIEID